MRWSGILTEALRQLLPIGEGIVLASEFSHLLLEVSTDLLHNRRRHVDVLSVDLDIACLEHSHRLAEMPVHESADLRTGLDVRAGLLAAEPPLQVLLEKVAVDQQLTARALLLEPPEPRPDAGAVVLLRLQRAIIHSFLEEVLGYVC